MLSQSNLSETISPYIPQPHDAWESPKASVKSVLAKFCLRVKTIYLKSYSSSPTKKARIVVAARITQLLIALAALFLGVSEAFRKRPVPPSKSRAKVLCPAMQSQQQQRKSDQTRSFSRFAGRHAVNDVKGDRARWRQSSGVQPFDQKSHLAFFLSLLAREYTCAHRDFVSSLTLFGLL